MIIALMYLWSERVNNICCVVFLALQFKTNAYFIARIHYNLNNYNFIVIPIREESFFLKFHDCNSICYFHDFSV